MFKERIFGIVVGLIAGASLTAVIFLLNRGTKDVCGDCERTCAAEQIISSENADVSGYDIQLYSDDYHIGRILEDNDTVKCFEIDGKKYLPAETLTLLSDIYFDWDEETKNAGISTASTVAADFYEYSVGNEDIYVDMTTEYEYFTPNNIVFQADGTVTDFKIVDISTIGEDNYPYNTYKIDKVYYETEILESHDYVIAGMWFAGHGSHSAIIYTNDKGEVKAVGVSDPGGEGRGGGIHSVHLEEINVIM